MTLLAPMAGLVALALGGLGLVVMSLLKLRRRPVRVGSTMLWEQAAREVEVNVPLSRPRGSWLLALHVLGLLLLAGAFARPGIGGGEGGVGRVVLLIDRTASMSALDGSGVSRLDRAKARAIELIERGRALADPPTFSLIAFAGRPELLARDERSGPSLRALITRIEPTDQPGDAASAFELAGALLLGVASEAGDAPSGGSGASGVRVVLLSDQEAGLSPLPGAEVVYEPAAGPGGAEPMPNAGLVAVAASRDFERPATVRLFARVLSTMDRDIALSLVAARGGEALASGSVLVPAATDNGPGEAVWSASIEDLEGGPLSIGFERPDAVRSDNTAWLVVPPWRRPAVMVAAPLGPGGEPAPDPYLMDVLFALNLRGLRVFGPSMADIEAAPRRGYQAIILDRVPGVDPAAVPLPSLGFASAVPGALPSAAPVTLGRDEPVLSWDERSALLGGAPPAEVLVRAKMPTAPEDRLPPGVVAIASVASGPVILEDRGPPRRIGVAFPLSASTWPLDIGFPIFVAAAIDRLTTDGAGPGEAQAFSTTEAVVIQRTQTAAPGDRAPRAASLAGPMSREIALNPADPSVNLGELPLAGLYTLSLGDDETRPIAVNLLDPQESAAAIDPQPRTVGAVRSAASPGPSPQPATREVWPWLVIALVAVAALEWLLYARRLRA